MWSARQRERGESKPVESGLPYLIQLRNLCTTGAAVHITSVTPWKAHGPIRTYDWGLSLTTPATADEPNSALTTRRQSSVAQLADYDHKPVSATWTDAENPSTYQDFYISASTTAKRTQMWGW